MDLRFLNPRVSNFLTFSLMSSFLLKYLEILIKFMLHNLALLCSDESYNVSSNVRYPGSIRVRAISLSDQWLVLSLFKVFRSCHEHLFFISLQILFNSSIMKFPAQLLNVHIENYNINDRCCWWAWVCCGSERKYFIIYSLHR